MIGDRNETRIRLPRFYAKYGKELRNITEDELLSFLYPQEQSAPTLDKTIDSDGAIKAELVSRGRPMITSKEEAVRFFEIDEERFLVDRVRFNSWPTTNGKGQSFMNYQVRLDTKIKPFDFIKFKQQLLEEIRSESTHNIQPIKSRKSSMCLELNIFDFHLGKVGYDPVTGKYNWSLDEADQVLTSVIGQALYHIEHYNISRIIFPVGNDFFNINSPLNSTVKGTPQMTGIFFEDIFKAGRKMISNVIRVLANRAPVEVIMVGGNHDDHAVFSLGEVLDAQFEKINNVTVNNQPNRRKYTTFGNSVIGYSHGDKVNAKAAHAMMSTDEPELFGKHKYKYFRMGHLHKNEKIVQQGTLDKDEYSGVIVERCPSLSPTDLWHYNHNWTGNTRRSKSFVYDLEKGLVHEFYYVL